MNEGPTISPTSSPEGTKKSISILALVSLALVVSLGVTVSNLRGRVQELSDKVAKLSADKAVTPQQSTGTTATLTSGRGVFAMNVPDGWGRS